MSFRKGVLMAGGMGLVAYPYFQFRQSVDIADARAAREGGQQQGYTSPGLARFRQRVSQYLPGVGSGDSHTESEDAEWEAKMVKSHKHPYHAVHKAVYDSHVSEDYNNTGQIARGEEGLTVLTNIFAQMGVLTYEGVDQMLEGVQVGEDDVFCDLGSGVGNVCLQVLHDSDCKKTVGVEVIPSRHEHAVTASRKAKDIFPDKFEAKEAVWVQTDLTRCGPLLAKQQVSILYTHSWMFDDALMEKIQDIIVQNKGIRAVITNKALPSEGKLRAAGMKRGGGGPHNNGGEAITLETDWNDRSEYFVYTRKYKDMPKNEAKSIAAPVSPQVENPATVVPPPATVLTNEKTVVFTTTTTTTTRQGTPPGLVER